MTTAKACLSGCALRGQHLTTCETRDATTRPCKGCLPRPAEFGNLCPWCFQRLTADVIDAAPLVRHLRDMAEPDAGRKPAGDGRTHGDPAWGAILSAAVGAADEVHMTLAGYAHLILEEHPNGARMAGPDERGVWRTEECWRTDDTGTHLRPSVVVGIHEDPETTARLVKWLLPMLPWCSEQEWAGEMRREIGELIRTTMARWPMAETRLVKIGDTLCPRCNRASLTYMPPQYERAPLVIACSNPECARIFGEDEYDRLVGLLEIAEKRAG